MPEAAVPDLDAEADRALLIAAAEAAGPIAMKFWRTEIEAMHKPGDLGPVTEADLAINRMLEAELGSARPGYGWLSEESEDNPKRLEAERIFIIDPIDGTRSFIAGEQGFSVALAIAHRGVVTAAAVHLPARMETFSAALGGGAHKNGFPIAASERAELSDATVLTARKQLDDMHWPGGVPPLKRHFRSSLAWRLCLVAEGRFDTMLTFRQAFEWDIAAGALIAAEAGANVTDGDGGRLVFNAPDALHPGIIAAPDALHGAILAHRQPDQV
ncbi:MAG: 3'(2'),5'-bisphosphate nucleotidase CysQ [Pseudomonadota bacterium]